MAVEGFVVVVERRMGMDGVQAAQSARGVLVDKDNAADA
jgi:hypothetical protein